MAQTLNQKVILWASGKVGQRVGAGECWDLANSALKYAGAGTSSDFGPTGDDADYVWGNAVDLKDALPGDILQYRDYVQTTTTKTEVEFADGHSWDDESWVEISHDHHTSVVSKNTGNGALTVLEQNEKGNHEKVKSTPIRWKDAATKTTTTKKMMKRKDDGKMQLATVTITVDVTITGTIQAYRPKVK